MLQRIHMRQKEPLSVVQILKWGIFAFFTILFIGNHGLYQALADKIDRELIVPYRRDFPLDTIVEITKTITPTAIVSEFSLDPTSTKAPVPTKKVQVLGNTIPEDELWHALTIYRSANGKKEISRSDKLCQYARKRADELAVRLKTNPEDPLDAHAGFKRDADSGYVFEFTGFTQVGENLAYTPSFSTGTQVIEWGWDTSTAHRTLQLSDDITHGCISGIHPIYVALFGS